MSTRIAPSADVSEQAVIGEGSSIWHLAQVRERAVLGAGCIVGRGAYIGEGARLGDNCKVQNYALVYEPARLGDGVFIGPAVVLTNDRFPRAVNPDGTLKSASEWAMVAAGAVVTGDVPAHALVAGVPARRIGWVGRAGLPLEAVADGEAAFRPGVRRWRCPRTGSVFEEHDDTIREVAD